MLGQGQVVHCPEYLEMTPAPSPCPVRRPHGAQKAMQPPAVSPALPAACHSTAVPASMAPHHSPHKAPRTDTTGATPRARTQADVCVKMYRRTIKYALDICKRLLITRSAQVPAPGGIFSLSRESEASFSAQLSWSPSPELQPSWWGDTCRAGGGAGAGSVPRWAGTGAGGDETSLCSCSCPLACPSRPCPASLVWGRL